MTETAQNNDGVFITVTGILKQAGVMETPGGNQFLVGSIHSDEQRRWPDGTRVATSPIKEVLGENLYLTRSGNSYHVESWMPGHDPADKASFRTGDPGDENDHPEAP